jgi:hypothetical protein
MSLFLFWLIVCIALFLHANFTFYLTLNGFGWFINSPQWHGYFNKVESNYGLFPVYLAFTGCFLLQFAVPVFIVVPIWVSWLQKQAMDLWNLFAPGDFKFSPDWRQQGKSVYTAFLLLIPNWLALCHFMSIIFAILGFDYWMFWDVSYHCWETTKPWYYKWLG